MAKKNGRQKDSCMMNLELQSTCCICTINFAKNARPFLIALRYGSAGKINRSTSRRNKRMQILKDF